MRQTEGEYDWTPEKEIRTGAQPRPPAGGALGFRRRSGTERQPARRRTKCTTAPCSKTPDDQALRVAAGRLAASLLRYADAVRWLEPAQARATHDPEIAYYLGLAYQGLGRIRDARLQFEAARRMPRFRAAGTLKLPSCWRARATGRLPPPISKKRSTPSLTTSVRAKNGSQFSARWAAA